MDSLPPVPSDLRRIFEVRAEKYVNAPASVPALPWIYSFEFDDPEDAAVLASVVAVHMIASTASSRTEPWLIRGVLRASNGGLVLSLISVEHLSDPAIEVTGVVLHRVPVARLRDFATSYLAMASDFADVLAMRRAPEGVDPDTPWLVKQGEQDAARKQWARRVARQAKQVVPLQRGRKGYPVDHYRRIALLTLTIYEELKREGRRDVVKELAAREGVPYQTVRDWIRRARELGFLGPTQRGRSQWAAGPNLQRKEE